MSERGVELLMRLFPWEFQVAPRGSKQGRESDRGHSCAGAANESRGEKKGKKKKIEWRQGGKYWKIGRWIARQEDGGYRE